MPKTATKDPSTPPTALSSGSENRDHRRRMENLEEYIFGPIPEPTQPWTERQRALEISFQRRPGDQEDELDYVLSNLHMGFTRQREQQKESAPTPTRRQEEQKESAPTPTRQREQQKHQRSKISEDRRPSRPRNKQEEEKRRNPFSPLRAGTATPSENKHKKKQKHTESSIQRLKQAALLLETKHHRTDDTMDTTTDHDDDDELMMNQKYYNVLAGNSNRSSPRSKSTSRAFLRGSSSSAKSLFRSRSQSRTRGSVIILGKKERKEQQ